MAKLRADWLRHFVCYIFFVGDVILRIQKKKIEQNEDLIRKPLPGYQCLHRYSTNPSITFQNLVEHTPNPNIGYILGKPCSWVPLKHPEKCTCLDQTNHQKQQHPAPHAETRSTSEHHVKRHHRWRDLEQGNWPDGQWTGNHASA